jgi:hypothetical protein
MDFDLNSIKNESQICLDMSEEDTKLFYVNCIVRKIVDKSKLVKMENWCRDLSFICERRNK